MTSFTITDEEFGTIVVRANSRARRVIVRITGKGEIIATIPHKRHLTLVQSLINKSRQKLRKQQNEAQQRQIQYEPGQMIGRHHQLVFRVRDQQDVTTRVAGDSIIITTPFDKQPLDAEVQLATHKAVKRALKLQAQTYLARRLRQLSESYGLSYSKFRLTSGKTRWGSCTSDNVISLNLWLMMLPDDLIDYVICHELCHTVEHNHSKQFWALVESHIPDWKSLRRELREQHPF